MLSVDRDADTAVEAEIRVGTNSGSCYHCLPIRIFHFLLGSGKTVLTMTGFVCGNPNFSKKFGAGDYVGDRYSRNKLVAHQRRDGACGHIREIQQKLLFSFIPFLRNSPTGHNVRHVFTLDGSNDVDSRKDVPFGSFVEIASHLGVKFPQNPDLGATNRRFQAKHAKKVKLSYFQSVCINCNHILHSDKRPLSTLCGRSKDAPNKYKLAGGRYLEKLKNCDISQTV